MLTWMGNGQMGDKHANLCGKWTNIRRRKASTSNLFEWGDPPYIGLKWDVVPPLCGAWLNCIWGASVPADGAEPPHENFSRLV